MLAQVRRRMMPAATSTNACGKIYSGFMRSPDAKILFVR
jgi:hypothetical protein